MAGRMKRCSRRPRAATTPPLLWSSDATSAARHCWPRSCSPASTALRMSHRMHSSWSTGTRGSSIRLVHLRRGSSPSCAGSRRTDDRANSGERGSCGSGVGLGDASRPRDIRKTCGTRGSTRERRFARWTTFRLCNGGALTWLRYEGFRHRTLPRCTASASPRCDNTSSARGRHSALNSATPTERNHDHPGRA